MKFNLDKILSDFKDYHIPVGLFVFIVGCVIHWFHGLDANFVKFAATVFTFLTGHAIFAPGATADTQGPSNPVVPSPTGSPDLKD